MSPPGKGGLPPTLAAELSGGSVGSPRVLRRVVPAGGEFRGVAEPGGPGTPASSGWTRKTPSWFSTAPEGSTWDGRGKSRASSRYRPVRRGSECRSGPPPTVQPAPPPRCGTAHSPPRGCALGSVRPRCVFPHPECACAAAWARVVTHLCAGGRWALVGV